MTPLLHLRRAAASGWRAGTSYLTRLGIGGPVTRSSITTFVVRAFAVPSTVLLQFGLVRLLAPDSYGEFIYAYTWYATLAPFAALGLHEAAVRFVAEYEARRDFGALTAFLRWSFLHAAVGALVVTVFSVILTVLLRGLLTTTLFVTLLVAWACIPLGSLTHLAAATLRALRRFGTGQAPQQVLQPLLIVGIAFALVRVAGMPANAVTAAWSMLTAVAAVLCVSGVVTARNVHILLPTGLVPRFERRHWVDAAVHFVGLIAILALWRVDVLMLGAMTSTTDAGVYATVAQVQLLVGSAFYTLEIVLAPTMAALHGAGDLRRLQRILRLASRVTSAVAALALIVLLFLGRWILGLFDPSFSTGYVALLILAGSQFFDVLTGSSGRLLTMTGHHRMAMWLMMVAMAVNVGLNLLLIPIYGMAGAALATASAVAVWKTLSTLGARWTIGIDTSVAAGWRPLGRHARSD